MNNPQPPAPKRPRVEDDINNDNAFDDDAGLSAMVPSTTSQDLVTVSAAAESQQHDLRSSSLSSPTLLLKGHSGSVYACEYSPLSGDVLCSASFDMTCLLWNHASGNYENFNVLEGHKNAVLDCHWMMDGAETTVVTCSADKTLMLWDAETGTRLRKWGSGNQQSRFHNNNIMDGHSGVVNACAVSTEMTVISVSDDGYAIQWDRRQKRPVTRLQYTADKNNNGSGSSGSVFPLTAVAATDTQLFTGSIDNLIVCWDLKMQRKSYAMKGHTDTITCLALHPQQTHLLSNSMDHTLRSWDIRPYTGGKNRHVKTFTGHKHSAEKGLLKCAWSPGDGKMVTCGSGDKMVHIWDECSTEELYLLPGHAGCVNCVSFHPVENVIVSGSSDKQMFVGELS